jgi:hypothetical protein
MSRAWTFAILAMVAVIAVGYAAWSCEACVNMARHFLRELFRAVH